MAVRQPGVGRGRGGISLDRLLEVSDCVGQTLGSAPIPEVTPRQVSLVSSAIYLAWRAHMLGQFTEDALYDVASDLNLDGNNFLRILQIRLIPAPSDAGSIFGLKELISNDEPFARAPHAALENIVRFELLGDLIRRKSGVRRSQRNDSQSIRME